jgi:hypothetical protein
MSSLEPVCRGVIGLIRKVMLVLAALRQGVFAGRGDVVFIRMQALAVGVGNR